MRLNINIARSLTVFLSCTALLASVRAQVSENVDEHDTTANLPLKVGGDVTAPRAIYAPAPEYSEEARAAGHQGTCVLSLIVGADGKPRNVEVVRRLGMQLDEKAIEAVRKWTFEPARKDGTPVAVQIKVEVSFRLYRNGEGEVLSPEMSEQMLEARSRAQSQIYRVSEGQELGACLASSPVHRTPSEPAVTVAELTFEGDLRMPSPDRDQIAASLKQRTYSGNPDEVASEIAERVKAAWQNSGYLKAQANTDARVLTSSPDNERIAVTVLINEGQQYRLEGIRFRNNRAITNAEALRNLFPLKDGDVFDRAAVAKGLENLRFAYGDMGYVNLTSVPDARFNEENQTISLDIDLDEGKQFYVSRIDIIGLDESGFQSVLKGIMVKPGDIYNQRLVDLFRQHYASRLPGGGSFEPSFNLQLNEREATVAVTYDFRRCQVD